ncbi:MAG: phosphoribosylaminoimidazolesuccinocarboxamide synthase, partial [Alphaproteobacteria bacterium]|nr:phosphoribosylaminoimidazolesuccinocarboxamide synthase [Alphaproteobacteria bacterium]
WFEEMDKIGIRTHHISSLHPNVSVNKEAEVLPIEFVVRSYLTGSTITSSWYAYQNNDQTICGIRMPDGMTKNQKFPENILTPTTKADKGGRDENVSREDILARNTVPKDIYEEAESMAMKMFAHGQKIADEKGLILVDTKYEMGLDNDGNVMVVDEVHTPDSSRYWIKDTYEQCMSDGKEPDSLDKEFVRNMIVDAGYDVDSNANPAQFMTDEIRLNAAKKYLALRDIFLDGDIELQEKSSIEDVLKKINS